jgi:mannose-1-phosphate guanylyltransferase/phosphomannomutase
MLELVTSERRSGSVALPVNVTRVAEQIATWHGVTVAWSPQGAGDLLNLARSAGTIFAGDGRGGMIIPEFSPALDGVAAFVRLAGLLARSGEPLSAVEARIPAGHVVRRSAATPWATKGLVMRSVVEAAGERQLDTTEGVRIIEDDGSWVLVLPDPAEAVTHLWAEGPDPARASALLQHWGEVVEGAGR